MTTSEPTSSPSGDNGLHGSSQRPFLPRLHRSVETIFYYGMTALHVEHIAGFSGFRAAVESIVGPLSTQALASQIFGLYSGFVYFTPLLGGMIADRWIGQRSGVVIGALSMTAESLSF